MGIEVGEHFKVEIFSMSNLSIFCVIDTLDEHKTSAQ